MATPPGKVQVAEGLEGVVAGTSSICLVDGARGRLLYRGYDAADLADRATFEEVAYLLWHGDLPARPALDQLRADLVAAGRLPAPLVQMLRLVPAGAHPMAVLRTAVSALAHFDPDAQDNSPAANLRKAVRLTAQVAAVVAGFQRLRTGAEPLTPLPTLGHAANFLYLLHGTLPDAEVARALDVVLILHADHEFNASAFAARVTAATLSDLHSAVVSAIGTLKGPLHGGANEEVMRLLEQIGTVDRVEPVIAEMLEARKKVPGFGHRVYRTEDPRARILRPLSQRLGERAGDPRWYELTRRVEEVTTAARKIHANVDLYSASVYRAMGIPMDLYTAVFAVSRIAGWTAHVMEQYADNRLIRPVSEYVGPLDRAFVPLEQRR
ncbi:MAG: citrate synthase [Armatimonadota bacterium]|nr:citrate synthase [Armatimonadota bacterium]MDR7487138.1 citrate synthase [Armatimonadota bacterium]MDR7533552.1 citrate synthase [Armatimonadota bacterium]MDR7536858.1 citrate synthase [Armatimonadota bacterium]